MLASKTRPTRAEILSRHCLLNLHLKECQEVLARLLSSNGEITTDIINYCISHNMRRFVIDQGEFTTHAQTTPRITTIERYPASLLFDYLPESQFIGACFHLQQLDVSNKIANYPMLYIAVRQLPMKDHTVDSRFCMGCSYTKAKEVIKSSMIIKTAFSIQLNGYAVRHVALQSNSTIKAICYGVDREFLLCKQEEIAK